ncbi:MAG: TIGR02281 family clan AA aspartic protease [Proteobacteria bacterium]|nr:TIGR02281 family clan AA aspartic protease [Pseudomonadota bacterium]
MVSSGVRNLGHLVAGWCLMIGLTAASVVYFDEIRTALGFKFTAADLGILAEDSRPAAPRAIEEPVHERAEPRRRSERTRTANMTRPHRDETLFNLSARLVRGADGHFHANAEINGRAIPVLVDTGATLVAMSYEDAQAAGISVAPGDFRYTSETANGRASYARVVLEEVRVGNVVVRNVQAAVSQPGRLRGTLLGMSFLGQLRMEMRDGTLVLEQ